MTESLEESIDSSRSFHFHFCDWRRKQTMYTHLIMSESFYWKRLEFLLNCTHRGSQEGKKNLTWSPTHHRQPFSSFSSSFVTIIIAIIRAAIRFNWFVKGTVRHQSNLPSWLSWWLPSDSWPALGQLQKYIWPCFPQNLCGSQADQTTKESH